MEVHFHQSEQWEKREKNYCAFWLSLQSHPLLLPLFTVCWKQITTSSLHIRTRKLDSISWREKYQRISGCFLKPPQVYSKSLQKLLANCSWLCYCRGLNSVFLKFMSTWNVTIFGNRIYADIISYEAQDELILGFGWTLNSMAGVFIRRREDTETQGRRPRKDEGRDWS